MESDTQDVGHLFRLAMRRFPAAVTIITTCAHDIDVGMTATAVTSLSMEPPSVLVCVNRNNNFHPSIEASPHFCVNILREGQQELSSVFGGAKPPHERFMVGHWQRAEGLPYLADAQAVIFCRRTALFAHATHSIVIGEAVRLLMQDPVTPLLYVDGRYASVTALP